MSRGLKRVLPRRCGPAPHLLPLLLILSILAAEAAAAERHALVVGINLYAPDGTEQATVAPDRGGWGNLEGAVDDARAMASLLEHRFGFPADNIAVLLDREATRVAILDGLRRTLLEQSQPGDTAVFFYAGHGSQVRNTASDELDGKDETLVPADACLGAPDIRDKELKRLLWQSLERGVRVVFVSDSCHSGSVTRGVAPPRARALPPAAGSVDDPDGAPDPAGHPLAIMITATQSHQRAQEIDVDGGRRGALSWSLQRALTSLPVDASARDVFAAARGLLRWQGVSQDPGLEGRGESLNAPLFGAAGQAKEGDSNVARTIVAVSGVESGVVSLDGGLALGLAVGCELAASGGDGPLLRIDAVDITGGRASVLQADLPAPVPGTLYEVVRWAPPPGEPLRFWLPPQTPTEDAAAMIRALQNAASRHRVLTMSEPTVTLPTHSVMTTTEGWFMTGGGLNVPIGSPGDVDHLLADAVAHYQESLNLLILAPPPRGLADKLEEALTLRSGGIQLVSDLGRADYFLMIDPDSGFGSWVNRAATQDTIGCAMPRRTRGVRFDDEKHGLAAAALADQASRLARIRGWHQLQGPGDDPAFPYRPVGLRGADGQLRDLDQPVHDGESLSLVLRADEAGRRGLARLARAYKATPRHLYVFAVDQLGNGFPLLHELFQPEARGLPPEEIVLRQPGQEFLVEVGEPYGTDTIFVLATEEPLPSMEVFDFGGVGVRSAPLGATSPLADLLYGVGSQRRGDLPAVPLNWSVSKWTVLSKAPAGR